MNASLNTRQDRLHDSLLWPLNLFYSRYGRDTPNMTPLFGPQVPMPYRRLLVHSNDMTPTLEAYHGGTIHIERLDVLAGDGDVCREVILRMDADERPVEYGASRVFLEQLPERARALLHRGRMPLGTILRVCGVEHRGRVGGFFRIGRTAFFEETLGVPCPTSLYGRRNTLVAPNGEPIAEVCEILPPAVGASQQGGDAT